MARNGRSLQDLAAEIERRAEAKQDFIAPVGKLSMEVVDDKPALALQNGALHTYAVNSVAHRQILGGRADMSDDVYALLTDDTKKKTDAAVWSQVRDVVRGAFEAARFEATVKKLGQAAGDQIEPERAVEVIERVGRKFSFNEGERKGILGRLIKDGDLTRYGLHAAITRYSQDEVLAYDRSSEMERIGGEVIDLAPGDWRVLAAA